MTHKLSAVPKNLLEMTRHFTNGDICVDFVAAMRWPKGVECPHCGSKRVSYLTSRRIWKCMNKVCHKQFSVKTGSVFEDSPVALDKWLMAVWLVVNCKNGISSYELARDIHVTQKTAWFMLHRIRLALQQGSWEKMGGPEGGPVEVDETFIGPNPRKMHSSRRRKLQTGEKASYHNGIVMGMLDRDLRKVRAKVIPNVKRATLQAEILDGVEKKATIYTDQAVGYDKLYKDFIHHTVNHLEEYVCGHVHTQGIDNFWSLLKRGLKGTYVAVEPFHLSRYTDEQVFRYNNRATKDNPLDDRDRFMLAVSQIAGKRLTYAGLTGKVGETSEPF